MTIDHMKSIMLGGLDCGMLVSKPDLTPFLKDDSDACSSKQSNLEAASNHD
jgi:hypothetical protein